MFTCCVCHLDYVSENFDKGQQASEKVQRCEPWQWTMLTNCDPHTLQMVRKYFQSFLMSVGKGLTQDSKAILVHSSVR